MTLSREIFLRHLFIIHSFIQQLFITSYVSRIAFGVGDIMVSKNRSVKFLRSLKCSERDELS